MNPCTSTKVVWPSLAITFYYLKAGIISIFLSLHLSIFPPFHFSIFPSFVTDAHSWRAKPARIRSKKGRNSTLSAGIGSIFLKQNKAVVKFCRVLHPKNMPLSVLKFEVGNLPIFWGTWKKKNYRKIGIMR